MRPPVVEGRLGAVLVGLRGVVHMGVELRPGIETVEAQPDIKATLQDVGGVPPKNNPSAEMQRSQHASSSLGRVMRWAMTIRLLVLESLGRLTTSCRY